MKKLQPVKEKKLILLSLKNSDPSLTVPTEIEEPEAGLRDVEPLINTDEQFEKMQAASTDEKNSVVKVRNGQGAFRQLLEKEDGMRCWMSGVQHPSLLIASHIKPWSRCDEDTEARGNRNNGLLLSALWDAAFDAGLISFDEQWAVIVSPHLDEQARKLLGLELRLELAEKFRNYERHKFLAFHRVEIFKTAA